MGADELSVEIPYGIVFSGVPGNFSVWTVTPHAELLDRETAEVLGQLAIRGGASDYRSFPLEPDQLTHAVRLSTGRHGFPRFLRRENAGTYALLLGQGAAVPQEPDLKEAQFPRRLRSR